LEIGGGEAFWAAVQGNLERLADARLWWGVVEGPVNPTLDPDGADVLAAATANLPPEPWNLATWAAWTATVKDATGAKGRRLFMPLRLALTGQSHGPELAGLLPLIGPRKVAARLAGQAA
ncbi:MAG: glutamate--tRNA ligase, partial [Pseudomonadota bacterium]